MESPRRKSGIFFALKLRCVDSTVTGWNLVGGRYVVWLKSTKVRQPIFRPGDSGSDDRYDCITEYFKKKICLYWELFYICIVKPIIEKHENDKQRMLH